MNLRLVSPVTRPEPALWFIIEDVELFPSRDRGLYSQRSRVGTKKLQSMRTDQGPSTHQSVRPPDGPLRITVTVTVARALRPRRAPRPQLEFWVWSVARNSFRAWGPGIIELECILEGFRMVCWYCHGSSTVTVSAAFSMPAEPVEGA